MAVKNYQVSDWVNWISGIDSNPYVIDGANGGTDEVYILAAYGDAVAETTSSNAAGTVTIDYNLLAGSNPFDTTEHYLVYIGQAELARIVSSSSSRLTISTDPYTSTGLEHDYGPGAPIELISTIHYKIEMDGDDPYLSRDVSRETYSNPLMKMCALNIEDLQVSQNGDFIDLEIVARSMGEHLYYEDPDHGDNWIRHTMASQVLSRNLSLARTGVPQAGGSSSRGSGNSGTGSN